MGLRESILGIDDRKIVPVECPEWRCTVHVRTLTHAERSALLRHPDANTLSVRLVVLAVCDEHGNRVFNEEDCEALAAKSASAVESIGVEAGKLNGLYRDTVNEAKKS